jgi:hypothetical protein
MQTWTDSFLENFNHLSQILGLCFLLLALGAGFAVYSTQKELTRRAKGKEQAAKTTNEVTKQLDAQAKQLNLQTEQLDSKTRQLEETEKKLAEARKAADTASAQLKEFQENEHQRVITPGQKATFIAATSKTKKGAVSVEIFLGGNECLKYATQIREMLTAAGFDTGSQVGQSLSGLPLGKGLIVWARDGHKLPPFTAQLLSALHAIGLQFQTHSDTDNPRIPADGLLITVGEAP